MSYCRWSSMNGRCDVYVYEDTGGGWTTHVAGSRHVVQPIPDILNCRIGKALHAWSGAFWDREKRKMIHPRKISAAFYRAWLRFAVLWHNWLHMGSMHLIPLRPIGLPVDGRSFNDDTAEACADRLEWLRMLGYVVPQYAIDELRSEAEK